MISICTLSATANSQRRAELRACWAGGRTRAACVAGGGRLNFVRAGRRTSPGRACQLTKPVAKECTHRPFHSLAERQRGRATACGCHASRHPVPPDVELGCSRARGRARAASDRLAACRRTSGKGFGCRCGRMLHERAGGSPAVEHSREKPGRLHCIRTRRKAQRGQVRREDKRLGKQKL